jgi:hypothetical protein
MYMVTPAFFRGLLGRALVYRPERGLVAFIVPLFDAFLRRQPE